MVYRLKEVRDNQYGGIKTIEYEGKHRSRRHRSRMETKHERGKLSYQYGGKRRRRTHRTHRTHAGVGIKARRHSFGPRPGIHM